METRLAGRGLHVADMMVREFHTIPVHATLARAVELLLAGEQREFPVVDNLGRTEGLLTRDNLVRGLSQRGAGATVAEAMTPDVPAVSAHAAFVEALERLRGSGLPALPVVDRRRPAGRPAHQGQRRGPAAGAAGDGAAITARAALLRRSTSGRAGAGPPPPAAPRSPRDPVGEARTQVPHLDRKPHPLAGAVVEGELQLEPAASCVPRLRQHRPSAAPPPCPTESTA